MLIFSRWIGDTIRIGETTVTALGLIGKDRRVRLGVEEPRALEVVREELLEWEKDNEPEADWESGS